MSLKTTFNYSCTQSTSVENTPVHFPAVLGKRAKVVEVPDTCGPFARQIRENSPQMSRYVPAGGEGAEFTLTGP